VGSAARDTHADDAFVDFGLVGGIRDGWNSIDWNASSTWATIIPGGIGSLVAAAIVAVLSRAHRAVRGSGYFALLLIVPAVWLVASAFGLMLAIHESEHSASSATLWRGASWIVSIGVVSSILSVGWRKLPKARDPDHIGPDFGRYRRKLSSPSRPGLLCC
jgi:hypothetical protein